MISKHGKERIKQRVNNTTKKKPENLADFVLKNGIPIEKTSGDLYRWIDKRRKKYPDTLSLLYQEHLYIYSKNEPHVLITVLKILPHLKTKANRLESKQRRNRLA